MYSNSIDIGEIVRKIARVEVPKIIRETLNAQTAAPEDTEPKPLTKQDIVWLVGKPIWCEYGTFKEWKVLKGIHINKNCEFILNFTDENGGLDFDEMKCYREELNDKVSRKENND